MTENTKITDHKAVLHSIGEDAAIAMFNSNWWEGKPHRDIAMHQMFTAELCCPFGVFHEAMEKTLGRPVFTHEFGLNLTGLMNELLGNEPSPSFKDVLALIPQDKLILVCAPEASK